MQAVGLNRDRHCCAALREIRIWPQLGDYTLIVLQCSAVGHDASTATMADAAGPPPRGKNLLKVVGALKKRALEERDEASPQEKKMRASINDVAADLLCPITQELPLEPVIAKDGKIYERNAILEWFSKKDGDATSPSTGKVIDTELVPVVPVRNNIESLIQTGAIEGEIVEAWQKRLEFEKRVKEMRAKAEAGNGYSMFLLGSWYKFGRNGLAKDMAQARAWYERSAAARDPKGLACFGECLLAGVGGPKDNVLGLVNATEAAHLGTELGAYLLGQVFCKGICGLSKDKARARFWLKKIIDGECEYKNLNDTDLAKAAGWLRELQAE